MQKHVIQKKSLKETIKKLKYYSKTIFLKNNIFLKIYLLEKLQNLIKKTINGKLAYSSKFK